MTRPARLIATVAALASAGCATGRIARIHVSASSEGTADWPTIRAITRSGNLEGPPGPNR